MSQIKIQTIPIAVADNDWFLNQNMTTGATQTTFSHTMGYPGKIAFSHDDTSAVAITVVYYRADGGGSYSDAISVAASDVAYTTYAVAKLVSVTFPSVTGKYLKVGYQETGYYFAPGFSESALTSNEAGAVFTQFVKDNSGDKATGVNFAVAIGTAPAANTAGYNNASQCIYYNYPTDTQAMAGELTVWAML